MKKIRMLFVVGMCIALGLVYMSPAWADGGASISPIIASLDGAANDQFGTSVSLSSDGNTALVGAAKKTISGNTEQGVAYVFVLSEGTWSQQAELTADDGAAGDWFGSSVSLSSDGNTALIGAYGKTIGLNTSQGAAYVFTRSGTSWTQKGAGPALTATDPAAYDYFGASVSLSQDGNTALIGASQKTVGGNSGQGAAYVFTLSGGSWSQEQKLTATLGAALDFFGASVSLSSDGNTALIGAYRNNLYQGAAYVFTRSLGIWTQQQKLTATGGAAGDRFGYIVSLSMDGNNALIGAPFKTIGGNQYQGAAYVFTLSGGTWTQQGDNLTASDGEAFDYFGRAVSLSSDGNTAIVSFDEGNYGAANVFTRSGAAWTVQEELYASDGAAGDHFGHSVSLSGDGNSALIGAPQKTIMSNATQGAAYVIADLSDTHTLTLTKTGSGKGTITSTPSGLNCGPLCTSDTKPYLSGTQVALTAKAAVGSNFAGWSGGGCTGSAGCTVAMSDNESVSALFTLKKPAVITSLSPTSGAVGDTVTITGTNFGPTQGSSTVTFHGTPATCGPWTDTSIQCTVPVGATTGYVIVTNSYGKSNGKTFTLKKPAITSLTPTSGEIGTAVTITGTNFGTTTGTVTFYNGKTADCDSTWTNTQIVCTVPSGTISGYVTVTNSVGTSIGKFFTVKKPVITSLSPTSGWQGTTAVTITGKYFNSHNGYQMVTFNGVDATSIPSWTDTSIVCYVPAGASTGDVIVTNDVGPSNAKPFTVK